MALFHYNPDTGIFTRIARAGHQLAGTIAGCPDSEGYLRITIDGKSYKSHRLAWLYVYGVFPTELIDHIDCDVKNNRLINLRESTNYQNGWNVKRTSLNKTGIKGVHWLNRERRYRAKLNVCGKQIVVGYYKSLSEAAIAYREASKTFHGEFSRTE